MGAWESLRENADKTLATAAAEVRGVAPELGEAALEFAVDAALRRPTTLVAVHAWQDTADPRLAR